jgi:hypothetical protein
MGAPTSQNPVGPHGMLQGFLYLLFFFFFFFFFFFPPPHCNWRSRDRLVGIATGYGLDDEGEREFESQ